MRSIRPIMIPVLFAPCFLAAAAFAEVDVIYTKNVAWPSSLVPGAKDLTQTPVVTNFRALEGLNTSPDGSIWLLDCRSQLGADLETQVLKGSLLTGNMFYQEGQPIPTGASGELFEFPGTRLGMFDSNNNLAFTARSRGGVSSVAQKVLQWTNSTDTMAIRFQQGDVITGLSDTGATNIAAPDLVGNSVGSAHLLDDGRIGAYDTTVTGLSSTRRPVLMYKDAGAGPINGFKQINVSQVTDFGGGPLVTLTGMSDQFLTTPDGAHWAVRAAVSPNSVFVYDGAVVLKQGQAIPNSGGAIMNSHLNFQLLPTGRFLIRGATATPTGAYAADNDGLIAKSGDPIAPMAPGENWGTAVFTALTGNMHGDHVIAGKTNNSDLGLDDVIVVNNNRVILREGDPIDVDGNGLFDDDAFFGRVNNTLTAFGAADSTFITPDRVVYAIINLRNGSGGEYNVSPAFGSPNAFVRITWCQADLDNDGDLSNGATPDNVVDINDLLFMLDAFEAGDAQGDIDNDADPEFGHPDGATDINDLLFFLTRFEAGC